MAGQLVMTSTKNVLDIALDFVRGFASIVDVIIKWLYKPIGLGDFSIKPIDALLPAGISIFLAVVVIQIIRR